MKTLRKAARNLAALSSAQIVARVSGLILTAYLARYLGEDDFGRFNLSLAFGAMFGVLARMGIRQIVVRETAVHPEKGAEYVGTATILAFFQSAAAMTAIYVVARILGYEGDVLRGM